LQIGGGGKGGIDKIYSKQDEGGWLESRLDHMESVLKEREWLAADRFTAADLLMADVLRVARVRSFGDRPATESYVTRITERPSFKKAYADQMAHFAAADEMRS
jgi:glutathione S-transferase